jgi:hypothetical protein
MNIKRAVFMAVLVVAIAALAFPLASLRARAGGFAGDAKSSVAAVKASAAAAGMTSPKVVEVERENAAGGQETAAAGKISPETLNALGIRRLAKGVSGKDVVRVASKKIGQGNPDLQVMTALPPGTGPGGSSPISAPGGRKPSGGAGPPLVGQPLVLNETSALSDALIITEGGRDTQFSEVALISDWDGREDCAADRGAKIDDFSFAESEPDVTLTRAAISEHTFANGHLFNSYYYGDSVGNLWFGFDLVGNSLVDALIQANIPAIINTPGGFGGFFILNPTPGDCTDDQVTVSGIAVNPVADLGDFSPALCGQTGEIIYVSIFDSEGCAANANNQPIRSRILAFAVFEVGGTEFILGGIRQVMRSKFANVAGVAVDSDGSLYYQLVDLIQFTGGGIFKATEIRRTVACANPTPPPATIPTTRVNRFIPSIPDPPTLNSWVGTTANPVVTAGGVRNTNYGRGSSTLYGDIVSITSGNCNVLYAAVSPSFVAPGDPTQGLFPAPSAFPSGTPSMIISFADCAGAFDICSGIGDIAADPLNVGGILPAPDGFADVSTSTAGAAVPGVNTYRIFVLGNGPDIRPAPSGTAIVPGTLASVLKLDMQIDYAINSGIAVSGEGTVFVISGGEPAGVGKSPSPMVGEVLCFEDACPSDRRADFVDLRGDTLPNPPASGGNVGDGDSDRFDHIFWQAPIDQVTLTPTGISGLNLGFLRYTNRLAPIAMGSGVLLGLSGTGGQMVLGDDATTDPTPGGPCGDPQGAIIFEALDPGHQVAGGDDQNTPFRGDDSDGLGNPVVPGLQSGGFEFLFGGPVGTGGAGSCGCVWNGFFWNSNGNITFGNGNTDNTPSVPEFRAGLPMIAPAWADLNPSARSGDLTSFPVQALGFVNVNAFKIRWINVPRFLQEGCTGTSVSPGNTSNTFAVTLYDDGTGVDENSNEVLSPDSRVGNNINDGTNTFDQQEGPTDLRFTRVNFTNPVGGSVLVGCPPRREGSGIFVFEYCRMDLLGTPEFKVLTGFSIGGLDPLNPPGLCETNLSVAAAAADAGTFGVLVGNQIAAVGCNCCIGEGTEPTIFELFNEGSQASIGSGGEITFAKPDFDLRFEGNDPATCTSSRQRDANRGKVCFFGIGCAPPSNPICAAVVPGTFVVTPTTTGLVNAICQVQLNLVGCGFFPNEVTTICQGFEAETGVPLQRPGKTVTTAATLACDTNGDGIAESTVVLTNVTPVSCNLITATIPVTASLPGTGFPAACCGGPATITVTTTFTTGDNNIFPPFTQSFTCALALGNRAPVVFSATPSTQACNGLEDLLITGACFQFVGLSGTPPVATTFSATSVFLQDKATGAIILPCAPFTIINNNLIDVNFCLTSAQAGHTFLVFVTNAFGTSRNTMGVVAGQPCPITGNEAGIQVTFACNAPGTPGTGGTPIIATVTSCKLGRQDTGQFFLDVTGNNIKEGATATVGGVTPKKIKVVAVETGTTNPTTLRLVKKVCNGLPGNVIITNTVPNGGASQPFLCSEKCPTN